MKRRFNYTGRKKIPRDRIIVTINKNGDRVISAHVKLALQEMNLPQDAVVYVEAYERMVESRICSLGTLNDGNVAATLNLFETGYRENLKFRIYVVDRVGTSGLILAHADRIKPERDIDRKAILPVAYRDIGQQIWKVIYDEPGGSPLLLLNSRIPNIETIAKNDPQFIMFVYPSVFREILTHMVFIDHVDSLSEPQVDWHRDWLTFANTILHEDPPQGILSIDEKVSDKEDAEKWIHRVIEEFCNHRIEWSNYIHQSTGETGGIT